MRPVGVATQEPELTQRPPLTGLADSLDRFLLPLVLISAAVGVSFPVPGAAPMPLTPSCSRWRSWCSPPALP